MRYEQIIIRPVITEKGDFLREKNQYQFIVHKRANKYMIKEAIEKLFNVQVVDVKTANYRGKRRRYGLSTGYTSHYKKATVLLSEGQKIEMVEGV